MTALQRAFALAKIDRMGVLVGEHLHLDVPGINDRLLDVNFAVAERPLGFAAGRFESRLQVRLGMNQPHAFSTTAGGRLQHHRVTDFFRHPRRLLE